MGLRLEIVSRHSKNLGERSVKEFGHDGGTIGRSLESDWVLPDGHRYLSSRHASIDYRAGSYYIIDTSTNGVYVNGSDRPVGRGNPQRLFSNDKIRIGEYVLRVQIDDSDSTGEQLAEGHIDPVDTAMRVEPADSATHDLVGEHEITGVGLDLLLDEEQSRSLKAGRRSSRVSGEFDLSSLSLDDTGETSYTRTRPDPSAPPPEPAGRRAAPPPKRGAGASSGTARSRKPGGQAPGSGRAARAERGRAPRQNAGAGGGSGNAALDALLRGAGLSAQPLDPADVEQVMHTLGRVLRETITGLTESLHLRSAQKNVLKQPNTTIQPRDNNPLKFAASVDESMQSLLFGASSEYMPPVDAVRGAFKDIKLHQQALLRALHTALEKYIERLDPDQVEEQFSSGRRGTLLGATHKLKYWDYYKDLYLVVCQHTAGELPAQFIEELAQAYEREIGKAQASPVAERRAKAG